MAPTQPCAKYQYVVTSSGPKIIPVPDVESKDEESPADYNAGGYLQVKVRDTFKEGRYVVLRKLGWGHFSTVWLVRDTLEKRHSALKVVKSAGRYAETARDEIKLLRQVMSANPTHPGRHHVVSFLDAFQHCGPEDMHVCIVFEPLGENLLALIERNKKKGVPVGLVKVITRQILLGLEYLHDECDLVHTDIKPENIMISIPDIESHIQAELSLSPSPTSRKVGVPQPKTTRSGMTIPRRTTSQIDKRHVHIFDSQPLSSPSTSSDQMTLSSSESVAESSSPKQKSTNHPMSSVSATCTSGPSLLSQTAPRNLTHTSGSSSSSHDTPTPTNPPTPTPHSHPTTSSSLRQSCSPSLVSRPPSPPPAPPAMISVKIADLGNATPSKKHYTEDIQTRQYRSPEAIIGKNDWDCRADVWSVACVVFELLTAEYLFDPQGQAQLFTKDDDHMAQIIELLGDFSLDVKMGGRFSRELFDTAGNLRYIKSLKPWPLESVMTEKYLFSQADAREFCDFMLPMLKVDFRKRANARDLVDHPWLDLSGMAIDDEW
ncbi:hypothetical protein JAAARDRAFT_135081 [Jaapia argillacea MUCL 33604]|uniref:non-specific serine/threonine protein kinase n=1 Tax=Jaapia argillacea MUCL 33604 TaxID=933084 RepID=A0A067PWS9_9AGAM|nr:hypothetical protein JAAARDRAFT_135081 [Jaapia argillacea MUCL 33604]